MQTSFVCQIKSAAAHTYKQPENDNQILYNTDGEIFSKYPLYIDIFIGLNYMLKAT